MSRMERLRRRLSVAAPIERFLLKNRVTEDADLARLMSKSAAMGIYSVALVSTLGTIGVDTKPLVTGLGITGFTIGFALKEIATNFISGFLLVFQKPFGKGCRLKVHGGGGGIEGIVEEIDIRYVKLRTEEKGFVLIPSAIVYSNPLTVHRTIESKLYMGNNGLKPLNGAIKSSADKVSADKPPSERPAGPAA